MLRVEVTHEFDRSAHLKEEYLAAEFDAQGRANRRIWVLEQQLEEMKREMEDERKRHEEEIEKERNVSSGLRDRVGILDEKRKRVQNALDESKKREVRLQSDLDATRLARQHESGQASEIPGNGNIVKELTVSTSDAGADSTLCTTPSKKSAQRDTQLGYVLLQCSMPPNRALSSLPSRAGLTYAVHVRHCRSARQIWPSSPSHPQNNQASLPSHHRPSRNEPIRVQCHPHR